MLNTITIPAMVAGAKMTEAVYLAAKHLKNMQTYCHAVQTIKKKMTDQAKALCETTLEMQELAKEIYFYDT